MKNRIYWMFIIASLAGQTASAQTQEKEGIQTPYAWMCTAPVDDRIDANYFWKDWNGNKVKLTVDGEEHIDNRNSIYTYNFYPSLSFSDDENSVLRLEGTGLQKATIIGVYGYHSEDDHVGDGFVMNLSNGIPEDETAITKAKIIHTTSSSRKSFVYKSRNLIGEKINGNNPKNNKGPQKNLRIMSYTKSSNPRSTVASTFSNIRIGGVFENGVTSIADVYDKDSFPEDMRVKRNMGIPELLVFDKALSDTYRQRVETYLALKYAITLDSDYMLDDVVWKTDDSYTRICGYGRLDRYKFNQSQVTTSERETPYYLRDTYYKNSFLNKSAYENLLVAGRMGELEDSTLVMFGDNDKDFVINRNDTIFAKPEYASNFIQEEDSVAYFPLMRIWRLENFGEAYGQNSIEKLELKDAEVEEIFAGSYNIKLAEGNNAKIHDLTTFKKNGEISWVASTMNGSVTVNIGSHVYFFDANGSISVDNKTISTTFKKNDMMEVVKKGDLLYVRRNGETIPSSRISGNSGETDWDILLMSNGKAFEIDQFHYQTDEYFNDFVELNYDYEDSLSFYSNGNIYLIASKNKEIKGDDANLKIYKMSAKDRARSKVLFENLDWEKGETYFTFAVSGTPEFGIADKKYIVEETMPNCVAPNNSASGKIKITFPDDDTYAYILSRENSGVLKQKSYASNVEEIENISNGNYTLYIAPFDGIYKFDVSGFSEEPEMISLVSAFNNKLRLSATWIVGDAQKFSKSGVTTSSRKNIECGVQIEDGMLYPVEKGKVSTKAYPVKNGDTIKVSGAGNNVIKVYVNGSEICKLDQDMTVNLYWAILTADGNTVRHIQFDEINIVGCAPVAEYAYTSNFISSKNLSFHEVGLSAYPIKMECPGADEEINNDKEDEKYEDQNNFTETNSNGLVVTSSLDGSRRATVRATLPNEFRATLTIYEMVGNSQYLREEMSMISSVQEGIFQKEVVFYTPGVYMAVVESSSSRLTGKFEIK